MLRVYLDQNKWIDLTKCRVGRRDGARFQDVYDLASAAVDSRYASFVLSCAHYYETQRRSSSKSRLDLAVTMAELSGFHTIAHPRVVVPAEIEQFLTGRAVTAQVNLFGAGLGHAFGTPAGINAMRSAITARLPPESRAQAKTIAWGAELVCLAAPEMTNGEHLGMLEAATKIREGAQKFVDTQNAIGEHIATHRLRHRLEDVSVSSEIVDFLQPLLEGCLRHGVDLEGLLCDKKAIRNLIHGLPSRWVTSELRRVRLRNPQQQWEKNDLNDIVTLSIAVPYCDVVVTEKQWARHINQLGLAQQYGTIVLSDLTELTDVLVKAS